MQINTLLSIKHEKFLNLYGLINILKRIYKMAWFNKKKEETHELSEIPELPQLPKLPELPSNNIQFKPNALPRFPSSTLGDKFSQNTIKDAISGEKEDDEELADEPDEEHQTMPNLPEGPLAREIPTASDFLPKQKNYPPLPTRQEPRTGNPMYVRLDKFEENMELFDKIKKQLVGVEKIMNDIKQTKEQEDKELGDWQNRLQTMKEQIEKIDRDIFSKVE
jgi:hypothetical protein